ncbi:MAG: hypothetical protein K6B14_10445 [Lachnospiraceae bacterium]|nr:hypothetical protein [Lachnospiraceae bacterium]
MSSSFSVTNNWYLRNNYRKNVELSKMANRSDISDMKLAGADSAALKRGIRSLRDYKYEDTKKLSSKDTDNVLGKAQFYGNLKAFADTYNYTLDSGKKSSNADIKKITRNMKNIANKYSKELDELGVTFDSKGYMKISASAVDNIKLSTYEEKLAGSDFLKDLEKNTQKIYRRIDTYL